MGGEAKGMLRIVGGQQDGVAAARSARRICCQERCWLPKVQIGRRLVHEQDPRMLGTSARAMRVSCRSPPEMGRCPGLRSGSMPSRCRSCTAPSPAAAGRGAAGHSSCRRAHEHGVEHGIVEDRLRRLRDIGDLRRSLPPGVGGKRSAGESRCSPACGVRKPSRQRNSVLFPAPFAPSTAVSVPLLHGKAHILQDWLLSVGKRQVSGPQFPRRAPPVRIR